MYIAIILAVNCISVPNVSIETNSNNIFENTNESINLFIMNRYETDNSIYTYSTNTYGIIIQKLLPIQNRNQLFILFIAITTTPTYGNHH